LDAEYVLESVDGLSIFGAEDPDWSAARAAERLAAREIANALDLFPSEAEELAADESSGSCCGAATSPDPPAESDRCRSPLLCTAPDRKGHGNGAFC